MALPDRVVQPACSPAPPPGCRYARPTLRVAPRPDRTTRIGRAWLGTPRICPPARRFGPQPPTVHRHRAATPAPPARPEPRRPAALAAMHRATRSSSILPNPGSAPYTMGNHKEGRPMRLFGSSQTADPETFPVSHTDEEWRSKLSPAQYGVLRKHGTERAGTSP